MIKDNMVRLMFERILAIEWKIDSSHRWSHYKLFFEHLRRVALCVRKYGWSNVAPVMDDLPARLNPSMRAGADKIQVIEQLLEQHSFIGPKTRICTLALHWAAIQDTSPEIVAELPAPYEPLIVLYERGGTIRRDHHAWEISGGSMTVREWHYYESPAPIVELDTGSLDAIDMAGKTEWNAHYKRDDK